MMRHVTYPHGGEEPQRPVPSDELADALRHVWVGAYMVDTMPTLLPEGTPEHVRTQAVEFVEAWRAWLAAHAEWRARQPLSATFDTAAHRLFGGDEIAIGYFLYEARAVFDTYVEAIRSGVPEDVLRTAAAGIYANIARSRETHNVTGEILTALSRATSEALRKKT